MGKVYARRAGIHFPNIKRQFSMGQIGGTIENSELKMEELKVLRVLYFVLLYYMITNDSIKQSGVPLT